MKIILLRDEKQMELIGECWVEGFYFSQGELICIKICKILYRIGKIFCNSKLIRKRNK